jgi:hypothetical protein
MYDPKDNEHTDISDGSFMMYNPFFSWMPFLKNYYSFHVVLDGNRDFRILFEDFIRCKIGDEVKLETYTQGWIIWSVIKRD